MQQRKKSLLAFNKCKNESHHLKNNLYTGRYIMFSVNTNIYNKKTKGPTLMELFTATGKLKKFDN